MLIPNATAGMIIGKGGEHIRAIKESTGAFVQLSRKNELPERCIIVSGKCDVGRNPRPPLGLLFSNLVTLLRLTCWLPKVIFFLKSFPELTFLNIFINRQIGQIFEQ